MALTPEEENKVRALLSSVSSAAQTGRQMNSLPIYRAAESSAKHMNFPAQMATGQVVRLQPSDIWDTLRLSLLPNPSIEREAWRTQVNTSPRDWPITMKESLRLGNRMVSALVSEKGTVGLSGNDGKHAFYVTNATGVVLPKADNEDSLSSQVIAIVNCKSSDLKIHVEPGDIMYRPREGVFRNDTSITIPAASSIMFCRPNRRNEWTVLSISDMSGFN